MKKCAIYCRVSRNEQSCERQLFELAYERLQGEFEVVLKSSPTDVKKKMDKALGRNQGLQEQI